MVAFRKQIRGLQAENQYLYSRPGNRKVQTDTVLKLCSEQKRKTMLDSYIMRLTKLLTESCAERERTVDTK